MSTLQPIPLDAETRRRIVTNLNRWLTEQGEPERAEDMVACELEKIPGTLCLTVTLASGRVMTGLLDLGVDYRVTPGDPSDNPPQRTWPWSWR